MLTLVEMMKRMNNPVERAVIATIAMESDLMANMPFQVIEGNALTYNVEQTMPGVAFRGINESFTESTGIINPVTESLVICGGEFDADTFLVDTGGPNVRAEQTVMKLKSLSHNVGYAMIKGDSDTDPRSLDGIQKRVFGTQIVEAQSNGTGDSGAVISWDGLSMTRDRTVDATHWLMTQQHMRDIESGLRANGQSWVWEKDEFGRRVTSYAGLPILVMDRNEDLLAAVGQNELAVSGATANKSSIYCVSLRIGGFQGLQFAPPKVTDLGEIQAKPAYRTRLQWYPGIATKNPRCITRYRGIVAGKAVEARPAAT